MDIDDDDLRGSTTRNCWARCGPHDDVAALAIATLANPWINGTVLDIQG